MSSAETRFVYKKCVQPYHTNKQLSGPITAHSSKMTSSAAQQISESSPILGCADPKNAELLHAQALVQATLRKMVA